MKYVSFSIDLCDENGDVYDECILIHINKDIILRFKNMNEYTGFVDSLQSLTKEMKESLFVRNEAIK